MTRMYNAIVDAVVPFEAVTARIVWQRLQVLKGALAEAYPSFDRWFAFSRGPELIPLDDEVRFIEMLADNAEQDLRDYPGRQNAGGAEVELTTAATKSEWNNPGRLSIDYAPWLGRMTLTINDPVEAFGRDEVASFVRACVKAVATSVDAIFIGTDVTCPVPSGKGNDTYARKHQLFPHRRWLGWMGFVPEFVPHRRIPEAAATEVVTGKGTVIVAVDEFFDLFNPEHLKRVHQVEWRMATVGLLDVTDMSLLE